MYGQILSDPVIKYDWKADSGEKLSLPLGTGIAKTLKLNETTWCFQVEFQYYVQQPDSFGADWSLTFDRSYKIRYSSGFNKAKA